MGTLTTQFIFMTWQSLSLGRLGMEAASRQGAARGWKLGALGGTGHTVRSWFLLSSCSYFVTFKPNLSKAVSFSIGEVSGSLDGSGRLPWPGTVCI